MSILSLLETSLNTVNDWDLRFDSKSTIICSGDLELNATIECFATGILRPISLLGRFMLLFNLQFWASFVCKRIFLFLNEFKRQFKLVVRILLSIDELNFDEKTGNCAEVSSILKK